MSNPLRWFRKNAKILMVVFGVGAMIIFGLGSVVSMINPSQLGNIRGDENKRVIAEWDGGKITRGDVRRFTELHFQMQRFLGALQEYAAQQKGDNFRSDAMPIPPLTNTQEINEEEINQRVVVRMLLAEKARREGILVNEEMVQDYLAMVAGEVPVTLQELRAIAKKATSGRIDLEHLVRHLQTELAAQQMQILSGAAMPLVPNPTEAFQYYVRTHKRAQAQVVPFDVKEYEEKITEEPPVSELRRIFNEGKYDYPDPTGEKPGFKVGKKVRVQYLIADFEAFLAKEMAKLTDEEVQKEYERLVAEEDDLVMEVVPEETADPGDPLPGDEGSSDAPAPPSGDNGAPGQPPTNQDENSDADPAPAPAPAQDDDNGDAAEGDGGDDSQDDGSAVRFDPVSNGGEQSYVSVTGFAPSTQSVSSLDQEQDPNESTPNEQEPEPKEQEGQPKSPEAETPAESEQSGSAERQDPPTSEPSTGDEASNQQSGDGEQDNDAAPKPESSQPENAAGADSSAAMDQQSGDDQQPGVVGPTIQDEPQIKKRPKPLAEVADAIKRRMKAEAARAAIEKTLRKAESKIRYYQAQVDRWEMGQGSSSGDKPEPLDLKALADELNLKFNETDLVDYQGLQEEPIGKIVTFMFGPDGRPVTQNVANMIFGEYHDLQLYEPRTVEDFATQSTYLYWLVEKVDQRVVSFDEAKEQVVAFWKRQRALELARQDAEKLAEQVNQSGKTLKELREDAVETGEFSWFTSLGQVMYSTPMGVENAGEEFMETVFSLKPGQAAVALNDTRDKVYVVQVTKLDEVATEELAREYLESQFFTFKRVPMDVSSVSNYYTEQINYEWMQELVKSLNVRWVGL